MKNFIYRIEIYISNLDHPLDIVYSLEKPIFGKEFVKFLDQDNKRIIYYPICRISKIIIEYNNEEGADGKRTN